MKFNVLLAAALLAGALSSQATTAPAAAPGTNASPEAAMTALFGDPAVARGKGFEIKRSDLDQIVSGARANAMAANQQLPSDFEISMLNQLIAIQVLLQTATPADHAAGQQEADLQYTNLLKKFISPDAFERQLKAVGVTVAELRAKATQEATAKAALKRALSINITDQEAKDYYDQHPTDFEQPELAHVRHILLMTIDTTTRPPTPLSTNAVAAKRKLIEELRKRILAGEDFATLAKTYSEDPGSKENGGELPNFPRGQMVAEFESAAFALTPNQVSDVVTSQYGFHIIKLLDKTPAKKIDFVTAEPDIKDGLTRLKIGKLAPDYVKKLRADQNVEILDANLKSMEDQVEAGQAAATAANAAAGPQTNK
jgi:peptidyl-prolyl cis-trans isomerase C